MTKEIIWDSLTPIETQILKTLKMSGSEIYAAPIKIEHKEQLELIGITWEECDTWYIETEENPEYLAAHKTNIISLDSLIESRYDGESDSHMTGQLQTMLEYEKIHSLINVENSLIIQVFEMKEQDRYSMFNLEILISLIIAVMAGVISHLICKWLDNNKK